jgi:hypothetical protein
MEESRCGVQQPSVFGRVWSARWSADLGRWRIGKKRHTGLYLNSVAPFAVDALQTQTHSIYGSTIKRSYHKKDLSAKSM